MKSAGSNGFLLAIALPFLLIFGIIVGLVMMLGGEHQVAQEEKEKKQAAACDASSGGNGGPAPAMSKDAAENIKNYKDSLIAASKTSGLPVSLLAAQIQQESGWRTDRVSDAGARGLTQFMPATWEAYGKGADPTDPRAGIDAQGRYMGDIRKLMIENHVSGDLIDNTLRGYNAGPYATIQLDGGATTDENAKYAPLIRGYWEQYKKIVKDLGIQDEPNGEDSSTGHGGDKKDENNKNEDKATKSNCSSSEGGRVGNATVGGAGDDYPWKNMGHCNADYSSCPGQADPTNAMPAECVAFAAWRVNQQMGGSAENIVFHSPGNAVVWKDHWDSRGWESGSQPQVGAIVYYAGGRGGASAAYVHVAVVKEVHDDGTFIEEGYNGLGAPNDHKYYTRPVSNDTPSAFLYISKK